MVCIENYWVELASKTHRLAEMDPSPGLLLGDFDDTFLIASGVAMFSCSAIITGFRDARLLGYDLEKNM